MVIYDGRKENNHLEQIQVKMSYIINLCNYNV